MVPDLGRWQTNKSVGVQSVNKLKHTHSLIRAIISLCEAAQLQPSRSLSPSHSRSISYTLVIQQQ